MGCAFHGHRQLPFRTKLLGSGCRLVFTVTKSSSANRPPALLHPGRYLRQAPGGHSPPFHDLQDQPDRHPFLMPSDGQSVVSLREHPGTLGASGQGIFEFADVLSAGPVHGDYRRLRRWIMRWSTAVRISANLAR